MIDQIKDAVLFLGIIIILGINTSCSSRNPERELPGAPVDASSELSDTSTPEVADSIYEDFLMGKFDPSAHRDFILVEDHYADKSGMYLQKEVYAAFEGMHKAAAEVGISLQIRSATRNFDYQKGIWERKWTGMTLLEDKHNAMLKFPEPRERAKQILRFSAMPGSSRHHWGTEIDLNAFDNAWFATGEGLKLYTWLQNNAGKYGFCQPYTAKGENRLTGYEEEKWHWSYLPLSKRYLEDAIAMIQNEEIRGFLGSETSTEIRVVEEYIGGIHVDCR